MRGEFANERAAFLGRVIGGDTALAAIAAVEIGRRDVGTVGVLDIGRSPVARIVAFAGALDLHDIGPEVGQ